MVKGPSFQSSLLIFFFLFLLLVFSSLLLFIDSGDFPLILFSLDSVSKILAVALLHYYPFS